MRPLLQPARRHDYQRLRSVDDHNDTDNGSGNGNDSDNDDDNDAVGASADRSGAEFFSAGRMICSLLAFAEFSAQPDILRFMSTRFVSHIAHHMLMVAISGRM